MRVPIRSMTGETVGEIELRDDVFGIEPNVAVMHQAVVRQQANARLGTHKTKTRAEVSGGGRKPWRQKGTGRARQGSIRAPQWRGGGTVFGPTPRRYTQKMNRKMRRLALRSALSCKVAEDQVVVMDDVRFDDARTRNMSDLLQKLQFDAPVLVLLHEARSNFELAGRNLGFVKIMRANCLSVRDLLHYEYLLMLSDSVDVIHGILGTTE